MKSRGALVVDPQGSIHLQLQGVAIADLTFHYVNSVAEAKKLLVKHSYAVGLMVFDFPQALTQENVESIFSAGSMTEWIALVTPRWLESLDSQAFLISAFHDFHTLPIDLHRLAVTLGHASGKAHLRFSLHKRAADESCRFGIYGGSPVMKVFLQQLEKVANADLSVLIGGETGTGKELVAKAIHKYSQRSSGPFVVVNCGAVPANLIQSELFGHEKGAFTGAVQRKVGSIEAANGGVLFLDEIGDLPLDMQTSLLRVLQERTISRLGAMQVIPVDFRVIAATHMDLREAVALGRFREDLFYRLNVIHLVLPPLRKRAGDAPLLSEVIFRRYLASNKHCRAKGFSSEAVRAINAYEWPGNVRELINRVHRAVIMSENSLISAADLGLESHARDQPRLTLEVARASFDRDLLETSLRMNGNKVSRAAQQLGVSRVTFYRMMNKLNIASVQ